MPKLPIIAAFVLFLSCASAQSSNLAFENSSPITLKHLHDTHQLVLTQESQSPGQTPIDLTHIATYTSDPPNIITVSPSGLVTVLTAGETTLTATHGELSISKPIKVASAETTTISFTNDFVPVLSKYGCNGGGCHGKAAGQNGFKLSLFGYEPWNDYNYLVRDSRERRIFRAAPEHSLLVLKATGEIPHQGGSRLEKNSPDYQAIIRWIKQGLPNDPKEFPKATSISVYPKERLTQPNSQQQLRVTAHFSDNSTRDISHLAQYESNDEERASVTMDGRVTMGHIPGSTSIMIRFQEHVDVFRAILPLGAPVENLPQPANFVDQHIFTQLQTLGLPPSEKSDDATFLRRVTIDIAGRLPSIDETNAFLSDNEPNKRAQKIEQLLTSPDHADYFAGKWAAILRNKRAKPEHARGSVAFHQWLRNAIYNNQPYHQIAREFLTASGETGTNPPVVWYRTVRDSKDQLENVAQVFLGVRMQCAQCHHHPYEKWSEDDYYGLQAFFSRITRKPGLQPGEEIVLHNRGQATSKNPRTGKTLKPKPLGGEELTIPSYEDPREHLADWMINPANPFFAKMLVNRYWKHFFGRGLVDPEDDLRVTNPATHPELLESLASDFIANGYDLKRLVRIITNSHTYQLSAIPNQHNSEDSQNYSRFYPRRLPAEILLDGINTVTGANESFAGQPAGTRAIQLPDDTFSKSSYFLSVFGRPDMNSACECERSADVNLAQALHLVNSNNIRLKLSSDQSRPANLAKQKDAQPQNLLTQLYLHALSRPPQPEELATALAYLQRKQNEPRPTSPKESDKAVPADPILPTRQAYEDLIWALLNTKEFLFNH